MYSSLCIDLEEHGSGMLLDKRAIIFVSIGNLVAEKAYLVNIEECSRDMAEVSISIIGQCNPSFSISVK